MHTQGKTKSQEKLTENRKESITKRQAGKQTAQAAKE